MNYAHRARCRLQYASPDGILLHVAADRPGRRPVNAAVNGGSAQGGIAFTVEERREKERDGNREGPEKKRDSEHALTGFTDCRSVVWPDFGPVPIIAHVLPLLTVRQSPMVMRVNTR